jgi:hypothetical protein
LKCCQADDHRDQLQRGAAPKNAPETSRGQREGGHEVPRESEYSALVAYPVLPIVRGRERYLLGGKG